MYNMFEFHEEKVGLLPSLIEEENSYKKKVIFDDNLRCDEGID